MTFHWIFNKSNMTGAIRGAGMAYPSRTSECNPVLVGIVSQIFSYVCSVLFVLFLLATDCLFKASDYPLWYLQTFLT